MTNIITASDPKFSLLQAKTQDIQFWVSDDALNTERKPLSMQDKAIVQLLRDKMNELAGEAVGIAAVQIGYPKNIFIAKINSEIRVFINAKIIGYSKEKQSRIEGCLSLPGFNVPVKRPKSVTVEYFDEMGEKHLLVANGKNAQVIVHEINHCKGVTLAEDFNNFTRNRPRTTSFGMKLTKHRKNVINKRRQKKKRK
jgi:peptide deformylase